MTNNKVNDILIDVWGIEKYNSIRSGFFSREKGIVHALDDVSVFSSIGVRCIGTSTGT